MPQFKELEPPKEWMTVRFYDHAKIDRVATLEKGRKVYKDVIYISKKPSQKAGLERCDEFSRPMREEDKDEWPQEWNRYLNSKIEGTKGTALDLLPACNPSLKLELAAMGITTVEALAKEEQAPDADNADKLWRQACAYAKLLEEEDDG